MNVLPGWTLIQATEDDCVNLEFKAGMWGLCFNKWGDGPIIIWKSTPRPSGFFGPEEEKQQYRDLGEFHRALPCAPEVGYALVDAAKKLGYEEGAVIFSHWLFNHLYCCISENEVSASL